MEMADLGALTGSREPSPKGLGPSGFDPERECNILDETADVCPIHGHSHAPMPCVLEDAIILAAYAHRGQVDKAGQPYILHPIRVMLKLEAEDRRIAAMLHDTVEDCEVELGEIRTNFGPAIADAVDALTRREGESYTDFIERCGANDIARDVKRADLTDNMNLSRLSNPTNEDVMRAQKYREARVRLNVIAQGIEARSGETA